MRHQKRLFQMAVVVLAIIGAHGAKADWFAGVGASLPGVDSKSAFNFAMVGDRRGDVTSGGFDKNTNGFPTPARTLTYNAVQDETVARFTGSANLTPFSGIYGFGLYGSGMAPTIFRAEWEPNGPAVPIVSYTWVVSAPNVIQVTVTNSDFTNEVSIRDPGWCFYCAQDVAPSGFSPPKIDLMPIPQFEVTLQPGESRETTLQGAFGNDPLLGFYAEAVFADTPGGPTGTIWLQTTVPEPSSLALAVVACFAWVGFVTHRVSRASLRAPRCASPRAPRKDSRVVSRVLATSVGFLGF
jgi:hypothetical protein